MDWRALKREYERRPTYENRQAFYAAYLNSPEWSKKRRAILKRDGYRCQVWHAHTDRLEVHHKTYDRLGEELPSDLVTLCHDCHAAVTACARQAGPARGMRLVCA